MANHGFAEPTANFTYDGAGEPGVFRLQAMRNMSAGDEVGGVACTRLFCKTRMTQVRSSIQHEHRGGSLAVSEQTGAL